MLDNINLARNLAWSFHHISGIDWEELFSEACVAYCEAIQSHKKDQSKETTWIYHCVRSRLISFCKQEMRYQSFETSKFDWYYNLENPDYEFFENKFEDVSYDVQWILRMIFQNPTRYYILPARKMVGLVRQDLRDKLHWKYKRIWKGMRSLRLELSQLD